MKEFNAEEVRFETASAVEAIRRAPVFASYPAYIGLDVHKETIAVSIARAGRDAPESRDEIANQPKKIAKLVECLNREFEGEVLLFCYEAGPCGYGLHRQLLELGHDCQVIAPSLIPRKPGERIKTDRRDACKLARTLRNGDLTTVWVPDEEQEAMRDLTRARDDLKAQERKARQQLNAYVLRQGHAWPSNKTRWTERHYHWLESLTFSHDWQYVVLQEYLDAVKAASQRVADIGAQMERVLPQWSLAPVVDSLIALRGIDSYRTLLQAGKNTKQTTVAIARELVGFIWDIACHEMPKVQQAAR